MLIIYTHAAFVNKKKRPEGRFFLTGTALPRREADSHASDTVTGSE